MTSRRHSDSVNDKVEEKRRDRRRMPVRMNIRGYTESTRVVGRMLSDMAALVLTYISIGCSFSLDMWRRTSKASSRAPVGPQVGSDRYGWHARTLDHRFYGVWFESQLDAIHKTNQL